MAQKGKKGKIQIIVFGVLAVILLPIIIFRFAVIIYHASITDYAFKNDLQAKIDQYRYNILCFVEDTQTDFGMGEDGYYYKLIGATNGEMYMLKYKNMDYKLSYFKIYNPGDSIHYYISDRIIKEDFSNQVSSEMLDKYPEYLRQFDDDMFYVINMEEDTKEAEAGEIRNLKFQKFILSYLCSNFCYAVTFVELLFFGLFTGLFVVKLTKYNRQKID